MVIVPKEEGFTREELARLDRVRINQQVLFLSCGLGASEKNFEQEVPKISTRG